jgi:hypothetical protein
MKNQIINRLLSGFLLFALSMATIPAETFHQHEGDTVVCLDQETHIEKPHFECELMDFVLPVLKEAKAFRLQNFQNLLERFEQFTFQLYSTFRSDLPQGRAPPFLSLGF